MKHYRAHDTVDEGFYWNPRRLAFKSLEERGRLPGEAGDAYVRIPALLVLPMGLAVSLAYVIFLPLIGFLMLGRILVDKLYAQPNPGTSGTLEVELMDRWPETTPKGGVAPATTS